MTMLASQITSLTVVYSIVYSGVNQRKHQSSASLAFVREIHRGPVNFPHKWPVTRKMFPFDDVIMTELVRSSPRNAMTISIQIPSNTTCHVLFIISFDSYMYAYVSVRGCVFQEILYRHKKLWCPVFLQIVFHKYTRTPIGEGLVITFPWATVYLVR